MGTRQLSSPTCSTVCGSRQRGAKEEATAAVAAGCDFIIVQGIEAGGHVRGRIGLLALLSEVLDSVDVPVLAAGGIGTGRAMAAALAAGADGVRVGTRFVAAEWAGESVGGVKKIESAADIVRDLADEAERLLQRWR